MSNQSVTFRNIESALYYSYDLAPGYVVSKLSILLASPSPECKNKMVAVLQDAFPSAEKATTVVETLTRNMAT